MAPATAAAGPTGIAPKAAGRAAAATPEGTAAEATGAPVLFAAAGKKDRAVAAWRARRETRAQVGEMWTGVVYTMLIITHTWENGRIIEPQSCLSRVVLSLLHAV